MQYSSENFYIDAGDIELHAQVTLPKKYKWFVTFVHGSFLQDKNGDFDDSKKWMFPVSAPKRNLFGDIEKYLLELNFASLRYDKRASGLSGGVYEDTDLEMLAHDVVTVIKFIKLKYKVPVLVIGQSEGGLTAVMAQVITPAADGLILQAGMLSSIEEIFDFQKDHAAKIFLTGNDAIFEQFPYYFTLYQNCYTTDKFTRAIHETNDKHYMFEYKNWKHLTCLEKYRQHFKYDGRELLKKILAPVSIIWGDRDANCPVSTAHYFNAHLTEYPLLNVNILPGLDHSFRKHSPTLTFIEQMKLPIDKTYWSILQQALNFIISNQKS